ncbi:hypothetical protein BDN72DRAFT_758543 [Pluteus cervinus]|uniref:Uncharacterized protein n=1 Tax=Pluteus cervinus TaxID=181527 RepID=A0ACD3BBH0_9AGAR|nr:hypothetical protein BDN72DRAFT_758543 [Pluteus cervinus]
MSSLAGALDGSLISASHHALSSPPHDVEMQHHHDSHVSDQEEKDEEMTDLFGQDEDAEETKAEGVASPVASAPESDRLPSPERERRQALEYEEDDAPPEMAVETKEAEVSFPNIPVPRSSDGNNWVIRIPNFVKVDSKPFHPDTYIGPEHDEEDGHHPENVGGNSETIKLKVENTLRWRWIKDPASQDLRQSNSRIIRWSDGSLSLRLGKENLDITANLDTSGSNQKFGSTQSSQTDILAQPQPPKAQGLTYLVAQHKRSQVLQAEALITGHMSLRPFGMQSGTHQMLVRSVGQRHNKVARLRMAPDPTVDPEREKQELIKQSAKKSKRKSDADGFGGTRKRKYNRKTADHAWSESEEELGQGYGGSEDEDDVNGSGKKPKKKEDRRAEDYQEDDFVVADSDDDNNRGDDDELDKLDAQISAQQGAAKRKKHDEDEDEDAGGMEVESEEDEEEIPVRKAGGTRKRAAVAQYDDDDDDEE